MNGHTARVSGLCAVLVLVACGTDTPSAPPPPITIAVFTGNNQMEQVTTRLAPIRVIATRLGNPEEDVAVTWSATGGTVNPTSTVTANGGIASTTWDLPSVAGTYTVQASAAEASNSPVTFSATALPGPPTAMTKGEGDGQSGPVNTTLPTNLQVAVEDAYRNPLAGLTITWSVTSGAATVTPITPQTDANGISAAQVLLGATPGPITVMASASVVLQGAPAVFDLTATP